MKPFAYADGSTVEEVTRVLDGACRPLAGGTDLLPLMKTGLAAPERLVNLKAVPGLDSLGRRNDAWYVGALLTLSRLAGDEQLGRNLAVLAEACRESASPQLRHRATLGGNLLQRPRCWYFRDPLVSCWLKGGERCFAVDGQNQRHAVFRVGPCHIAHPSDPAVALLALDASVVVVGPEGGRTVPLADFIRPPRQAAWSETSLALDELVTAVHIPHPPSGARGAYLKVAQRAVWDFSLVSAAVQLTFEGDTVRAARVALGGVAPVPWRAREAEAALLDGPLTTSAIARTAEAATSDAKPLSRNGYKIDLIRGTVAGALRSLQESKQA